MQPKNNVLIIGLLTLVVGLGTGYYTGVSRAAFAPAATQTMNHDMGSTMSGMLSGLQGKTGLAFEKEFLTGMIAHHEGAVAMAELLLQNTQRPELVKLGNDIITAQTGEIAMMKQWQKEWFNQ